MNNSDAVKQVKSFIYKEHQNWKKIDAQSMTEAEFLQRDNRIHCVFYFISPHQLKSLDLEFIKEISPLAPIVPIISKADIMTAKERAAFLSVVRGRLDELSSTVGEPCVYDFQGDDSQVTFSNRSSAVHADDEIPPSKTTQSRELVHVQNLFAVVCDSTADRVYPWGTVKVDDPKVSDFRRLQKLLFENGTFCIISIYVSITTVISISFL